MTTCNINTINAITMEIVNARMSLQGKVSRKGEHGLYLGRPLEIAVVFLSIACGG